ncbi:hypothetical protein EV651_12379 [Kribbella sp. VKM Ac-2571]|uniref:hypothetical protein n=1 Tax=Kribbella sp. VKM Ac-2571 TaxID=2512222 RepID=UPI00105F986F|nr:hypothetical protein [Kribbella sp. VKM Ac-2571]TDO48313.1 hypothetical protein EV651_12379 [Kribbella sp. VKM Ac-2571]
MGADCFSFGPKGEIGPRLTVYRAIWRAFCGASVALGVVAAVLVLPTEIVGLALLAILLAGATALGLYGGVGTPRWTRRQVVTGAAVAAAVTTLVLGLTIVLGPSVFWLTVLLAAASPPAVHWCGVRLGLGTAITQVEVPKRSTADLCRQWRESCEALRHARTDNQRLRIVMERQRCLDELDRRDPEGLQAWLASAASAAGDPARFLKSQ